MGSPYGARKLWFLMKAFDNFSSYDRYQKLVLCKVLVALVIDLYMLTSFLRYPVFQNLMCEKVCLAHHDQDLSFCSNVSAYYSDQVIQAGANHFYFLSAVLLPSLLSTLASEAAADMWSIKVPL
ncbi:unnamed protein product [Cylicocyclus nassatus]|uniref:Uncharacterized protein n=1 Tax=Cylicocyclus nassatus TaxID=53992 RepID=A0AA36GMY2_CYLNA|nr:unnamed protein product [Cylicocyclus nassatus]